MTVTLSFMRETVRRMTARYTQEQLTDASLDTYINLFYTLHFPANFKNIKLTKPYVFNTIPNVDTYPFPYENGLVNDAAGNPIPGNIQISPPVYCQGYILRYYQDKTIFYNRWPKLSVNQQVATTNSTADYDYTFTIPPFPFLRCQLDIFGNVTEPAVIISTFDTAGGYYTATDQPKPGDTQGNQSLADLVDSQGNVVGEVNYLTGAAHFTATFVAGNPIYAAVVPYQASRPVDVIFYNQQITFRPVPAQVYQVEFQISQMPTQLIADNSMPELDEWYLMLCAGAAKLIYTDFPDPEGMNYLMPIWQEQLQIAQRRTLKQLGTQRANTIFSTPGRPRATWFLGTEYSGTSG